MFGSFSIFFICLSLTKLQISNNGSSPSSADLSQQYFNIETNSLLSSNTKIVDIPRAYNYLKISVWTASETSDFKYWVQSSGDSA